MGNLHCRQRKGAAMMETLCTTAITNAGQMSQEHAGQDWSFQEVFCAALVLLDAMHKDCKRDNYDLHGQGEQGNTQCIRAQTNKTNPSTFSCSGSLLAFRLRCSTPTPLLLLRGCLQTLPWVPAEGLAPGPPLSQPLSVNTPTGPASTAEPGSELCGHLMTTVSTGAGKALATAAIAIATAGVAVTGRAGGWTSTHLTMTTAGNIQLTIQGLRKLVCC